MKLFYLFLFSLYLASNAKAVTCGQLMAQQRAACKTFLWGNCGTNIKFLIKDYEKMVPNFEIDKATVLLMYGTNTAELPYKSIAGNIKVYSDLGIPHEWRNHIALLYKGRVYDPSFRNRATVLPLTSYLGEMILGTKTDNPNLANGDAVTIKLIPATVWRDDYFEKDEKGRYQETWVYIKSDKYPESTVTQFLENLKKTNPLN